MVSSARTETCYQNTVFQKPGNRSYYKAQPYTKSPARCVAQNTTQSITAQKNTFYIILMLYTIYIRSCVALGIRVCIQYVCKHKLSVRNGLLYLLRSASKSSRYTRPVMSRLAETFRDNLYRKDHNGSRAENVLTG
jgi:tRNA G26 N,N-dimethylase Trm1